MIDGKFALTVSQYVFTICHMGSKQNQKTVSAQKGVAAESNRLLWQAYADNSARHIMALSRHMQLKLMNSLTESGYDGLRLNYEPFIAALARQQGHSGNGGIRPSQLAAQQGISKQVCNQILNQLERHHYIERVADPDDGRARLIHLTRKGGKLAADGQAALAGVERLYQERAVYVNNTSGLNKPLALFAQTLGVLARGLSLLPASLDLSRLTTAQLLGSVLPPLENYLGQRLMALTMEKGHPDIAMAHASVLTLIGLSGGRIQQMAQTHNVSKQAISAIASELVKLGYIERQSAVTAKAEVPMKRSSLLVFTKQGWQLIADSIASVAQLEDEFEALIAEQQGNPQSSFKQFKEFSAGLYHALRLEEDVFDRPLIQIMGASADAVGVQQESPDLALLAQQLKAHLGPANARRLAQLLD